MTALTRLTGSCLPGRRRAPAVATGTGTADLTTSTTVAATGALLIACEATGALEASCSATAEVAMGVIHAECALSFLTSCEATSAMNVHARRGHRVREWWYAPAYDPLLNLRRRL